MQSIDDGNVGNDMQIFTNNCNEVNTTRSMGLPRVPSNMVGGSPLIAIMLGARLNQVGKYMLVIMANPVNRYDHQEEGCYLFLEETPSMSLGAICIKGRVT